MTRGVAGRLAVLALVLLCATQALAQGVREQAGVVRVSNAVQSKRGSGFVVHIDHENGRAYILTAFHVVEADKNPSVEFVVRQGQPIQSTVVRLQRDLDLALLAIPASTLPGGTTQLELGPPTPLEITRSAYVIGSPRTGAPWSVLQANVQAVYGATVVFGGQIAEGVSGGPLLQAGVAIGLVTSRGDESRGLPASAVSSGVLSEFIKGAWGTEAVSPEFSVAIQGLRTSQFREGLVTLIEQAPKRFRNVKGAFTGSSSRTGAEDFDSEVTLPGEKKFPKLTLSRDGGSATAYYWFDLEGSEAERYHRELVRVVQSTTGPSWLVRIEDGTFTATEPRKKLEIVVAILTTGVRLIVRWADYL